MEKLYWNFKKKMGIRNRIGRKTKVRERHFQNKTLSLISEYDPKVEKIKKTLHFLAL